MSHRSMIIALAIFSLFILALPVFAYNMGEALSSIETMSISNAIDNDTSALYRAYAVFAPEKLPMHLQNTAMPAGGWFCATPAIIKLKSQMAELSPAVQQEILGYLQPGHPVGNQPKSATDSLSENPAGYFTTNSFKTEHFNIKWGDDTWVTQDEVDMWAAILEEVWDTEVVEWGWNPVLATDQYYIDAYVGNSGDDAPNIGFSGAYTTVYYQDPYQPYVVFHPDIFGYEYATMDVSSHEFFHTMQFTIAFSSASGCWGYMGEDELWGVEGTATWAEDECYDDLNGYKYYIDEYANAPHYRLTYGTGLYPYSRAIWFKYLSENFGGRDAVYDMWNDGCYGTLLRAVGQVFLNNGTDLITEYPKFAIANLFKDYEEGSSYGSFKIHKTINEIPDSYESVHETSPQLLGTNYVQVNGPADAITLYIKFDGELETSSRTINWNVQVLAMTGSDTYDLTTLTVTNGVGEMEISGFGDTYSKAYIVISPLTDVIYSTSSLDYTLSVSDEPFVDADDDDDNDDNENNTDECTQITDMVYTSCDMEFSDGGSGLTSSEAMDMCSENSGPWECIFQCMDNENVTGCSSLKSCLTGYCGLDMGDDSGSGDSNDDGGCGC